MIHSVTSNNNISPLRIYSMGWSKSVEVTHFGPGRRNYYIIHYVTEGKGYYNGNPVSAGQGFLIYPGMNEEYHADTEEPWEFLWIISDDERMNEMFKRYDADPKTMIFRYDAVAEVKNTENEIVSKNKSILDSLEILGMYIRLANGHLNKEEVFNEKSNSEVYLDFCKNYVKTNIYKEIRVSELTKLLGVSQPYLYKIFERRFNMSPKEYIVLCKINLAKKLLKETDMTVTEIANSVGYSDCFAFSRIFSKKENISPQKFRNSKK